LQLEHRIPSAPWLPQHGPGGFRPGTIFLGKLRGKRWCRRWAMQSQCHCSGDDRSLRVAHSGRDDGDRDGGRLRLSSCASASGPKSSWACDDRPGPLRVLSQLPTRAQATSGSFNWSALPAGFQPQRLPAPGEGPLLSYGACRHPAPALHGLSGPLYIYRPAAPWVAEAWSHGNRVCCFLLPSHWCACMTSHQMGRVIVITMRRYGLTRCDPRCIWRRSARLIGDERCHKRYGSRLMRLLSITTTQTLNGSHVSGWINASC
jgi:hypothetical protein